MSKYGREAAAKIRVFCEEMQGWAEANGMEYTPDERMQQEIVSESRATGRSIDAILAEKRQFLLVRFFEPIANRLNVQKPTRH